MGEKTREEKTLTARQIAERYGVARSTVRGWLMRRILPGARLVDSGLGDSYWVVPESSLEGFTPPKPGPAPKPKGNGQKADGEALKRKALARWEGEGGKVAPAKKTAKKKGK